MKEIVGCSGIQAAIQFATTVESPWKAGFWLRIYRRIRMDTVILPDLLEVEDRDLTQFAFGFVQGRHGDHGWAWTDQIDKTG